MIGTEKQFYKKFNSETGRSPHTLEALSPPQNGYGGYSLSPPTSRQYHRSGSMSGGGGGRTSSDDEEITLCDTISRKSLFRLDGCQSSKKQKINIGNKPGFPTTMVMTTF